MALRGTATMIRNIRVKAKGIQSSSRAAMEAAVLFVRRESMERVPVDYGHLKASHETEVFQSPASIRGEIRVTAAYALFVHESPMKLAGLPRGNGRGFYWDPQGKATNKFLEKALFENQAKIMSLFIKQVRI